MGLCLGGWLRLGEGGLDALANRERGGLRLLRAVSHRVGNRTGCDHRLGGGCSLDLQWLLGACRRDLEGGRDLEVVITTIRGPH